jgi:hypothetical protein
VGALKAQDKVWVRRYNEILTQEREPQKLRVSSREKMKN